TLWHDIRKDAGLTCDRVKVENWNVIGGVERCVSGSWRLIIEGGPSCECGRSSCPCACRSTDGDNSSESRDTNAANASEISEPYGSATRDLHLGAVRPR